MRTCVPNALSVSRIVIAFVLLLISRHLSVPRFLATAALLVIAMITDALDGYLARRWKVSSASGYVLDAMGDRAVHLALILVVLVRYDFHPLFVWLLVFRDIAIYAVRVLSKGWLQKSRRLRWVSLWHATILRGWLGLYVVRDGFRVLRGRDVLAGSTFEIIQWSLLCCSLVISYYGLARSFNWLIDYDHEGT